MQPRIQRYNNDGSGKFFRSKVLKLSRPEILREAENLDKEARGIKRELLRLCWYMRGLSYSEVASMSYEERSIITEIIKDNLETTKKTKLPFF